MVGGERAETEIAASRARMMLGAFVVSPLAAGAWLAIFQLTPPPVGFDTSVDRLGFALGWLAVTTLLTLVSGVEAVAHERLFTPAINPLAGAESPRLKVNLRYLQNTLEQLVVFAPGLLLLAWQAADAAELRAVTATAVVWIVLRFVFWIGYHRSHELRTPGLVGMMLSMLVLMVGVARFGHQLAGPVGAILPIAIFGAIEAVLVVVALRAGQEARRQDAVP